MSFFAVHHNQTNLLHQPSCKSPLNAATSGAFNSQKKKKKLLRALRAYVLKRAGVMDQENYEVNKVLLKKNERTK